MGRSIFTEMSHSQIQSLTLHERWPRKLSCSKGNCTLLTVRTCVVLRGKVICGVKCSSSFASSGEVSVYCDIDNGKRRSVGESTGDVHFPQEHDDDVHLVRKGDVDIG